MCSLIYFHFTIINKYVIFIAWGDYMKKKIIIFSSIGAALLIGLTILIICLCLPKGSKSYRNIKIFSVNGLVNVKRNDTVEKATKDMKLKNDDVVEVLESSSTVLKLDNDKFIMAKENTTLKLTATGKEKTSKTRIIVEKGGVVVEVKEKLKDSESFEIASSNSVMAIRGTQISFNVEVKDNKITTSVLVLEGNTEIMLFKNEKLSSTKLNQNFKLSYTTDLTDASNNISEVIDKGVIEAISDSELEEVFNVVKETLTSEEIDTIVDIINTFERDDDLVNHTIKFSFTKSPMEGENPKDFIEIEKDYKDLVGIKYLYSKTIDGTYSEFDTNNPLEIGEWYCKLEAGNAYRSDPIKFSVIEYKITLSNPINLSPIYLDNYTALSASFGEELEEFFNSDLAKTPSDEPEYNHEYKYYVIVNYGDPDDSDHYMYQIYLNCEDFSSRSSAINLISYYDVYVEYSLPEYYEIENCDKDGDLMFASFEYEVEDTLNINYAFASLEDDMVYFNALLDFYSLEGASITIKYTGEQEGMEQEAISEDGICKFNLGFDECSFYLCINGTDIKSSVYTINKANFPDTVNTGAYISSGIPAYAIVTYNSDNSMNFYYDLSFNGINQFDHFVLYKYEDDYIGKTKSLYERSDNKYSVVTDTLKSNYIPSLIGYAITKDDFTYVNKGVAGPSGSIAGFADYGYINAADPSYYIEGNGLFVKGSEIKIYGDGLQYLATVAESDYYDDFASTTYLGDYEGEICYFSGEVYGHINSDIVGEFGNDYGAFTDEAFEYIKGVLLESGITIKGSNKHILKYRQF